jgi:type IV secretion system protein VirB6
LSTINFVDCEARAVGGYGFGALADPSSSVSIALTALVTIFIALYGIRLLLGPAPGTSDTISHIIRIGLVLTIASSWPAWRTVAYDVVLDGPTEIARAVGVRSGLPGSASSPVKRLQDVDDGIVAVTMYGSGRLTGGVAGNSDIGDTATGVALPDQFALGLSRTLYLGTAIGSTAFIRLGAGILLALAPLMAGLALFNWTIGIFTGWLRGLAFCALGSVALLLTQGAMTALLFPWLDEVVALRGDNVLTASAPTELLAMTLGYAILTSGILFLVAKLTFFPSAPRLPRFRMRQNRQVPPATQSPRVLQRNADSAPSRADVISQAVTATMRRTAVTSDAPGSLEPRIFTPRTPTDNVTARSRAPARELLGDSFRRSARSRNVASSRRKPVA